MIGRRPDVCACANATTRRARSVSGRPDSPPASAPARPEIDPMGRAGGFGMIFAETHVRFASPGFYEEMLRVDVRPEELRRSSVRIAFRMVCEGDGRLVAEGWGTLVGYDYSLNRAARLPEAMAARRRAEAGG